VGLIGAGGISRAHLPAYQRFPDRVELAAVCDVRADAAAELAATAGVREVFADAREMLERADVDAVDICTVHDQHAPLAIAAAEAGKHVLVEKPMACSLAECRRMVEAAEVAGVTLMVAQNQRYDAGHRAARRAILEGQLGPVRAIRSDAMQNLRAFLPSGHWLYDGNRAGGGVVISVAVHKIDLVRYLVGDVRSVTAVCRTMHPEFVNGAEDYACALLEFEGGAVGEMFATYSGFRMPYSEQLMVFGDGGTIHTLPPAGRSQGPAMIARDRGGEPIRGWTEQFTGFAPLEPEPEGLPDDSSFVNEILHFAECCRTGAEPVSSGRDNLGTMRTIFAIYESARTGGPVELATL
jgi:predicted dehydrogenase